MLPLWSIGGSTLGWLTAHMGAPAILVCTKAVESAVDRHMREQIAFLRDRVANTATQAAPANSNGAQEESETSTASSSSEWSCSACTLVQKNGERRSDMALIEKFPSRLKQH